MLRLIEVEVGPGITADRWVEVDDEGPKYSAGLLAKGGFYDKTQPRDKKGRFGRKSLPGPSAVLPLCPPGLRETMEEWYCGRSLSFSINGWLRGETPGLSMSPERRREEIDRIEHAVEELDGAIEEYGPLDEEVAVSRYDGPPSAVMGTGRIAPDSSEAVGWSFVDEGYGSTVDETLERPPGGLKGEFFGQAKWNLRLEPGLPVIWGANPGERELVIGRGVKYTITGARKATEKEHEKEGLRWVIEATVEPQ
jgi:hypothetical protein